MKQLLLFALTITLFSFSAHAKPITDTASVNLQVGYSQKTATLNVVDSPPHGAKLSLTFN